MSVPNNIFIHADNRETPKFKIMVEIRLETYFQTNAQCFGMGSSSQSDVIVVTGQFGIFREENQLTIASTIG